MENSWDGIAIINQDYRLLEANQRFADMLGYTLEELPTLHVWDWEANFDEQEIRRIFSRLELHRETFETLHRRKDGSIYDAEVSIYGTIIDNETVVFASIRDVSKRKQLEKELRGSMERALDFKYTLDQVHDCVFMFDAESLLFTYTNMGAILQVGYSEAELRQMHPYDIKPDYPEPAFREMISPMLHGEMVYYYFETVHRHRDGHDIPVDIFLQYFKPESSRPYFIAIVRDIRDRKALETELLRHKENLEQRVDEKTRKLMLAKEAADSANQAKSTFIANMSHEIRTPLTSITGMVELLRNSDISQEQKSMLDNIDIASEHLLDVINAILDMAKIEAGKVELETLDIDLEELVINVSLMVRERAKAKGLQLVLQHDNSHHRLIGDQTRLQQALLNYVSNAVKFTQQGQIHIRTSVEELSAEEVLVRFEVQDTGIGIERDVIDRLFATFEQADNSDTRSYGGTGLGLAITKKIAELYQGEVGVVSELGVGSTFWLTCRLKKSASGDRGEANHLVFDIPAMSILARDFKGNSILVVDDEPVNRMLATTFLADKALQQVETVEDGAQALEALQHKSYDLILMDMQMPVMNGLEATEKIRQLANGVNVPIIAMTANAYKDARDRCIAAGMNDLISKPYRMKELHAIVLKWISSSAI